MRGFAVQNYGYLKEEPRCPTFAEATAGKQYVKEESNTNIQKPS